MVENGQNIIDDINSLFTFFKCKSLKEEELLQTLEEFEGLEDDKIEFITEIFVKERQRLIDSQKLDFSQDIPILTSFNWRFEVEVSSRERKKSFVPNFLLNFGFVNYGDIDEDGEREKVETNLCANCDYGTLQKLYGDFHGLNHYPKSISYRKMTRGIQRLANKL